MRMSTCVTPLPKGGALRSVTAPNESTDWHRFQHGVRTWSRLHGFVSLELGGAFTAMRLDADALFAAEVHDLAPRVS